MAKRLPPKHERFVKEYLVDLNATKAAERAGYSVKTAKSQGSRLLTNVDVQAAIQKGQEKIGERAGVNAEWVISSLKEVAQRCMQKVPVMVFDKVEREMVRAKGEDPETGELKDLWEFDSSGANRALELLGKHIGMFKEHHKHEHTGKDGGPIETKNDALDARLSNMSDEQLLTLVQANGRAA